MPFGHPPDLVRVNVAGDNEDRIARSVVSTVEIHRVLPGQGGDLVLRADRRSAIRAVRIERGHQLLVEGAARITVDHLPALLDDHIALGEDTGFCRSQVDHAIRFHGHHQLKPVRSDPLGEGGVVDRGERVKAPAIFLDSPVELTVGKLARSLEHQVLEEMRGARLPCRIVRGPDPVPDHLRHHRSAMVLDDDDHQAIVEGKAAKAGFRRQACNREREERQENEGRQDMAHAYDPDLRLYETVL